MMGCGKTSIGKLTSRKLKLDFFDIDSQIEKETKMTISKIFTDKGENFFREIEERITINILKKKNVVIALGGGAFMNEKIRKEILKDHLSFWLQLNTKTLIDRIKNSLKRPIAANSTNLELINLIKKRSNIYSKALYRINCNNLTKTKIVNKILDIYEKNETNS